MDGHIDQQNMVDFLPEPSEMSGDEKVDIHRGDFPNEAVAQHALNLAKAALLRAAVARDDIGKGDDSILMPLQ